MWGLGCLIWETFNGDLPRATSLKVIGKVSFIFICFFSNLLCFFHQALFLRRLAEVRTVCFLIYCPLKANTDTGFRSQI